MKSIQILAIVVVAVVVVAGVAAYVVLGDKDSSDKKEKLSANLPVYGNADDDYIIDDKDIDIMEDIMDGKKNLSDFPLADSNRDGKVTQADIDIAKKVINGETVEVFVVDQGDRVVKVQTPLDHIITVRSDVATFAACAGFNNYVYGFCGSANYANIYAGILNNGGKQLSTGSTITDEVWNAIVTADSDLYKSGSGIGAVITDRTVALGDYEDDLETTGIPALIIRVTDPALVLDGTLLVGFLIGGDAYAKCREYVKYCEEAMEYLDSQLKTVSEDKRVKFISCISYRCVSGDESQYTKLGVAAGGITMTKVKGDTSPQLQTKEAITEYDDLVTQILMFRTMGCCIPDYSTTWGYSSVSYMEASKWYDTMVFINCSMPVTCRVLYCASVLYPELISEDYADEVLQYIIDNFMGYLHDTQEDKNFSVKDDMTTVSPYSEYKAYLDSLK